MKEYQIITGELSAWSAAAQAKCPRCRKGDLFENSMYGLRLQKMHVNCPCCGLKFEKEPGYFYVAMFVSYAMNVAEMIGISIATYLVTANLDSVLLYISVLFPIVILLSPFNYRFSRVALLYWLTPGLHYDPGRAKNC